MKKEDLIKDLVDYPYGWNEGLKAICERQNLNAYDIKNITYQRMLKKYGSYKNYVKSSEWAELSRRCIVRDKLTCQMCGSHQNLCAHHVRYNYIATLGDEELADLLTLCIECHNKISKDYKQKKENAARS
ncbi:MAG: hypothetical protein IJS40_09070 [Synergistaceae bacterium]|nr:hypothetical protein [Synergistaceae bacterium]